MDENEDQETDRFQKQIDFLIEIDKVKNVFRKTRIFSSKRYENDAEHGWHMSLIALILAEYSNEKIDISKVVKMSLIHDLVEIDVGDTFLYAPNQEEKSKNERKCAIRIFGILPKDQRDEYLHLWEEFEAKETAEAKFAGSIDRIGPIMQNHFDDCHAWKKHNISADKVLNVNMQIEKGSRKIWDYAKNLIEKSIKSGKLKNPET
jgi:putative hydrolase of HD superfamily